MNRLAILHIGIADHSPWLSIGKSLLIKAALSYLLSFGDFQQLVQQQLVVLLDLMALGHFLKFVGSLLADPEMLSFCFHTVVDFVGSAHLAALDIPYPFAVDLVFLDAVDGLNKIVIYSLPVYLHLGLQLPTDLQVR